MGDKSANTWRAGIRFDLEATQISQNIGLQVRRAGKTICRSSIGVGMMRLAFALALPMLVSTASLAQQTVPVQPGSVSVLAIEPEKIQWKKDPNGGPLETATLVGDLSKPGLYILLVKWPPHTINKAHSHPDDRYVVVLSGTFYHGYGDKFDESKLEKRSAGAFFTEPTPIRHFGMTKDEGTILYFVGTGPTRTDDPEK
jgi:quercetin dioxygenase-like cupin family protein